MKTAAVFVCVVLVPFVIGYPSYENVQQEQPKDAPADASLVRVVRSPEPEPFRGGGFGGGHGFGFGGGRGFGGGFGRGFGGPRFGGGFAPPPYYFRRRRPYYYGGPGYYSPGYSGGSASFAFAAAGSASYGK